MADDKLNQILNEAKKAKLERDRGYREQSLRIHPHVCAKCGRSFDRANLQQLTVHHKDHNHDNNPPDGSNWENLCIYCHDNEHQRYEEQAMRGNESEQAKENTTYNPFAALKDKLKK